MHYGITREYLRVNHVITMEKPNQMQAGTTHWELSLTGLNSVSVSVITTDCTVSLSVTGCCNAVVSLNSDTAYTLPGNQVLDY